MSREYKIPNYYFHNSDGLLSVEPDAIPTGNILADRYDELLIGVGRLTVMNQAIFSELEPDRKQSFSNLGSLLVQHTVGLPNEMDYNRHFRDFWESADTDQFVTAAAWAAHITQPHIPSGSKLLARNTLRRASKLGLFGSMKKINRLEGISSLQDLYEKAGLSGSDYLRLWDRMPDEELLRLMKDLSSELGRTPTYKAATLRSQKDRYLPHPRIYARRFGSWVNAVKKSELRPNKDWAGRDNSEFIEWGVMFAEANNGLLISERLLSVFRDYEHYGHLAGPPLSTIARKFQAFSKYQKLVAHEYSVRARERSARVDKLRSDLQTALDSGEISPSLFKGVSLSEEILSRYARYKLADAFLEPAYQGARSRIAKESKDMSDVMKEINGYHTALKVEDLEDAAIKMNIRNFLWPAERTYLTVLRVAQSELKAYQQNFISLEPDQTNR